MALTLIKTGEPGEANELLREALAIYQASRDRDGELGYLAHCLFDLGVVLCDLRKFAEAEAAYREALAAQEAGHRKDHGLVAKILWGLAWLAREHQNFAEAETLYREALAAGQEKGARENLGRVADLRQNVAEMLKRQQRFAEAETVYREALEAARKLVASEPLRMENLARELAELLYRQQRFAEGEAFYREALASRLARDAEEGLSDGAASMMASLGRLLADWAWSERAVGDARPEPAEHAREAERLLRESLAIRMQATDGTHWRLGEARGRLGAALIAVAVTDAELTSEERLAKFTEAEKAFINAHHAVKGGEDVDRKYKRDALVRFVRLYEAWEKPDQALEWQRRLEEFDNPEPDQQSDP